MTETGSGSGVGSGISRARWVNAAPLREASETTPLGAAVIGLRLPALAFSVPYLFAWSAGLSLPMHLAVTGAHACVVLAVGAWLTIADYELGVHHHLGARASVGGAESAFARVAALPLAVAAVLLSLPLLLVQPFLPALVGGALAGGWAVSFRISPQQRYNGLPEVALPLGLLAIPGVGMRVLAPPGPSWWSLTAGAGFLLALLLAVSERDANRDAAAGIVTVSRRWGVQAERTRWLAGLVAAGCGLAGIYFPLGALEWLAILGALGFVIGMTLPQRRVLTMAIAHAVYSLAVLFGLP